MPVETMETVKARMKNPVIVLPEVMQALFALNKATGTSGVPSKTIGLVQLRASQINGCSVCVDMHCRDLKKAGETDDRLLAVAAWRDAPYFTEAERAALALGEAVTRLSDRPDPVPDGVWEEASRHYERASARRADYLHRADQHLESPQRRHAASRGRLGEIGRSSKTLKSPRAGR